MDGNLPAPAEQHQAPGIRHPSLPVRPDQQKSSSNTSFEEVTTFCTTSAFKMTISSNYSDDGTEFTESFKKQGIPQSKDHKKYSASRNKEFNELVERGVFTPVFKSEADGHRIFGSHFVDHVKHECTPDAYEKSRLVVQGFNDKSGVLTHAPSVQRASQRVQMSLCASDLDIEIFVRDVSQAYVQSSTKISRPIFVKSPSILGSPPDILFRVNCPLYGIPEARNHWFFTYHNYHMRTMNMSPSILDPCFLYTKEGMSIKFRSKTATRGTVCLQTDDTAYAGNEAFQKLEENARRCFDSKEVELLTPNTTISFNGRLIHFDGTNYIIKRPNQIQKMSCRDPKAFTVEEFVSKRARGSYVAAVCRPDVSYLFSVASQAIHPREQDAKDLNKAIKRCLSSLDSGLTFVHWTSSRSFARCSSMQGLKPTQICRLSWDLSWL